MKSCQQCERTKPMVVRWFVLNYGQIPWNGFMFPREKRALLKAFTVIDDTQEMTPEILDQIEAYFEKGEQ